MTQNKSVHAKRNDIQGLRCIAVLAVLLFHANHSWLPGGYLGVDIFFVLSGYLITGTLLRPMEAGTYSIIDFYSRRVRRLFPALFAVLAFTLVLGLIIFPPPLLMAQLESLLFTVLFLSNFFFEDKTNYFAIQTELIPLIHTWSLGVEEQFYLLFPPILYALFRWARKLLWPALFMCAALSLYYSQTLLSTDPNLAFYSPVSRAFELLIGALCVGVERHLKLSTLASNILSLTGLVMISGSLIFITQALPFPGAIALIPCLGTAALILSAKGWGNILISSQPFASIGDVSYSLYLWHWPALVFSAFLFPNNMLVVMLALAFSIGAAFLSYHYIEQPVLRTKPRHLFKKALAAMIGIIAISLPIYYSGGWPQRFSGEARSFMDAANDYNHDRPKCHMRGGVPMDYADMCHYGDASQPASFIVLGDSHGTEFAKSLGESLAPYGLNLKSSTMSGCPAALSGKPGCIAHIKDTVNNIINDSNMKTVILSSSISGKNKASEIRLSGIQDTALKLKAAGKQVVIIYPFPTFDFDPPSLLATRVRMGADPSNVGQSRAEHDLRKGHINAQLDSFTAKHNIDHINTTQIFCDQALCYTYKEALGVLYYNQGHVSLTGAQIMADQFIERFVAQ